MIIIINNDNKSAQLSMEYQQWYLLSSTKCSSDPRFPDSDLKTSQWGGTGYQQWTFSPSFLKLLILGLEPTFRFENQVSQWNLTPGLELSFTMWRGFTDSSPRSQIPLRSWQQSNETGIIHKLKWGKTSQNIKKKLCTMTTTEHWKREVVKRHFGDVVRAPSLQIFTA